MSGPEVFLDAMPGETRGAIARDGRWETLILHRESDRATHRLGARSVGRVTRIDAGMRGAFVDLGGGEPGFLASRKGDRLNVGDKLEVEVSAEPREAKGPTLTLTGPATGEVRMMRPGPSVAEALALLAPGVEARTGVDAIRSTMEAEEEATSAGGLHATALARVSVERTRALVAVDVDHVAGTGRDAAREKARANREALFEAARLIRLKGWGGLVAIDLIGVAQDGEMVLAAAKAAFGADPRIVHGPVNRFGVLMLSLPWGRTPLEERLNAPNGRPSAETRALAALRRLRLAMAQNTATPYLTLRCPPEEATLAAPWVEALGPRARLRPDPTASGATIDEG
ncbi:ribonuclease E/G [Brevundimonas sp.]|uniref:ribonuclease E/G n=1 Tax=Brevundimonas sp. TaxID=1871086 RepID=UPI00356B48A0